MSDQLTEHDRILLVKAAEAIYDARYAEYKRSGTSATIEAEQEAWTAYCDVVDEQELTYSQWDPRGDGSDDQS